MVVQHNLRAMNSNRMLGLTVKTQNKSTEKLSSGYKINRAADDAAGLSISEKMRKQIRGLSQASLNAQDGISAVQTAEGALNEVQDMLQRANELAVKAANGTMSVSDRSYIQSEIDQLVTEIDRVSTTTKFNETYLLKGNNKGSVGKLTYATATAALDGDFGVATDSTGVVAATGTLTASFEAANGGTIDAAQNTTYDGKTIQVGSTTYILVNSTALAQPDQGPKLTVSEAVDALNKQADTKAFSSMDELLSAIKDQYSEDIKSVSTYIDGKGDASTVKLKVETFADLNDAVDLSLQVGSDSSSDNKINMNVSMMSARGLGVNGLKVNGETADNATKAIDTIASALQKVSQQRSSLGSIQNRLEHTINNLDNVVENTTSAESQIRDTDMATEMVKYSNNNILAQAGQAMLAQSNQANQGVLGLLN
ncbi:MAG: flagellin [Lachnospiraceae bacterium]